MSWFSRLFNRTTKPDAPTTSRVLYTGRTTAGVYVDADNALRNATVWACVQYLTRTVAKLPWRVMVELPTGKQVARSHPVDYLLNKRPNPEMGAMTFRQTLLGSALIRGNGYAEIERDNRGVPVALWPLRADRVAVKRDADGRLIYEIWGPSGNVILRPEDVFHVRGFGDGPVGYSVVEYAAQSIGWAQATELFGAAYFGEGMNPSGIVSVKQGLSLAALNEMRASLEQLYKGPKGKRTMILDAGAEFTKLSTNPNDSQFIETRQHQIAEICRWFGVPPHKVMDLMRATFSNIEHQSIEVVVDSIAPWVKAFEEEADYKLFGANRSNFYTNMPLQALMRGDNASRSAFYKAMLEMGAMTINEIRALEDMNGIGEDGDVHFVSNNVRTLGTALAEPAEPAPDPLAPQDPASPDPAQLNFRH